jgi:hypothetical protein
MTSSSSLFEALGEIVREHESYETHLTVVPVLYRGISGEHVSPSFVAALGVMSAAAHLLGGVLLDTDLERFDEATETERDPTLEGALPTSIAHLLGPATELQLEFGGGRLDAQLIRSGHPIVATGGEARFLAVVRSLFAPELRECTFAIIAYREAGLDTRLRSACFRMLCGLQDHPGLLASLRTLVVAVETQEESPAVHCRPGVGARYILRERRLLRRHDPTRLASEVGRLVQQPERPVVLFLAAGFAVSSGLPIGNRLRDEAIARILGEDPEAELDWPRELYRRQNNLLTASERSQDINVFATSLTFEQVMRVEHDHSGGDTPRGLLDFRDVHERAVAAGSGASVRRLQEILARPNSLVIVTVNFDELVENESADLLDVVVSENAFREFAQSGLNEYLAAGAAPRRVPYLKLHGTISDLDSCVASRAQTGQGLSDGKVAAINALIEIETELRWVYIGASMRDIDLRPVLDSSRFKAQVDEYWVSPIRDVNVESFARGREELPNWRARDLYAREITETADTFMTELAKRWLA